MRMAAVALAILMAVASLPAVSQADKPGGDEPILHVDRDGRSTFPEAEPNDACPGQGVDRGDVVDPASIDPGGDRDWYVFTALAGEIFTVGTDVATGCPTTVDTYLYIYAEDCTTVLAEDDDGGPGFFSWIANFQAPYSGEYNVLVKGYSEQETGCYKLDVCCGPPPPFNDTCEWAIEIPCSNGTIDGDLTDARNDYDPGITGLSCTGYRATGPDVTYRVELLVGMQLVLTYTTPGYDGSIYVITDCERPGESCVVGADDPEPETIQWIATGTGTYWIIADAYTANVSSGAFTLDFSVIGCVYPVACCFPDGHCEMFPPPACYEMGGVPGEPEADCDPNPCEVTAMEKTTWGRIRGGYR